MFHAHQTSTEVVSSLQDDVVVNCPIHVVYETSSSISWQTCSRRSYNMLATRCRSTRMSLSGDRTQQARKRWQRLVGRCTKRRRTHITLTAAPSTACSRSCHISGHMKVAGKEIGFGVEPCFVFCKVVWLRQGCCKHVCLKKRMYSGLGRSSHNSMPRSYHIHGGEAPVQLPCAHHPSARG